MPVRMGAVGPTCTRKDGARAPCIPVHVRMGGGTHVYSKGRGLRRLGWGSEWRGRGLLC